MTVGQHIERDDLAKRGRIPVRCECGWDGYGELEAVDRYTTDYPPIPWVDIVEITHDPERGHIFECPECEVPLELDTVFERDPDAPRDSGKCSDCPGGRCACWVDRNEDVLKSEGGWPRH